MKNAEPNINKPIDVKPPLVDNTVTNVHTKSLT